MKEEELPPESPLSALLAALGLQEAPGGRRRLKCGACGLRYSQFRNTGLLGCPDCYRSFAEPLGEVLEHIHGCRSHTGKRPARTPAEEKKRLKNKLDSAVKNESYEEAAALRDKIARLEKECS